MLVKIRLIGIRAETDKALLCEIRGCNSKWLPKKLIITRGNVTLIPEWLAAEKDMPYKVYTHIPDKIEPVYNQDAINELKY